jgi:predicted transposase YbfD/YdcC
MQKANIIKGYSLDETKYKRICAVLDTEGEDFPSIMVDDFELVLGWFNADKSLSDANAKARYAEILSSREDSGDVNDVVEQALEVARELVEEELVGMVSDTARVIDDIKRQYYAGIYAIAGNVVRRELQSMKKYPVFVEEQPALPEGQG